MKAALPLLLLCISLPPGAAELQLSVISNNATHRQAWLVAQAALKRAGVAAVAREVPAERGLALANSGATDGDVGRILEVGQAFPALVRVPEPVYHYATQAFAYRRIDMAGGWQALRPYSVCVRRGIQLFRLRTEGMRRQLLDDEQSVLRMLRSGGCEVALLDRINPQVAAALAADPPLLLLTPDLELTPLYLYLHKRHASLVPRVAEMLRQMRLDGTMQRLTSE
jgi:polar amino acid transport system substrate-binding protein